MQAARLSIALALLLLVPASTATLPSLPLEFRAPAEFGPASSAAGLQWALLFFHGPTSTTFDLSLAGAGQATNHTFLAYGIAQAPVVDAQHGNNLPPQSASLPDGFQETLAFQERGWASLYIEADNITLTASGSGKAVPLHPGHELASLMPDPIPPTSFRSGALTANHENAALLLGSGTSTVPFSLRATGLHHIEYSNAGASCPTSRCLDGARPFSVTPRAPGGQAGIETRSVLELAMPGGGAVGQGEAALVAAGGPSVDLTEAGAVRLPFASRAVPCAAPPCLDPQNRTLRLEGNFTLGRLHAVGGDRLATQAGGAFTSADLDETPVSANLLGNLATVATIASGVAFGALLIKLLIGLFSREVPADRLLDNPRRRRVHDAVLAHPGATYRVLMEASSLSDSVTRHHLKKLAAAGLIVAQQHGKIIRYFENHGRYTQTWKAVVAHRDPSFRHLLGRLRTHPNQTQQQLIDHAQAVGLNRMATQRRLHRLEAWGLIQGEPDGRTRRYRLNPMLESPGPDGEDLNDSPARPKGASTPKPPA
jgi:predicted transcriptional regulator